MLRKGPTSLLEVGPFVYSLTVPFHKNGTVLSPLVLILFLLIQIREKFIK